MSDAALIYKVVPAAEWLTAKELGAWPGAPVDLADGFIHFSTAAQVAETLARHFAGQTDLMLVEFRSADFGPALKWEPSRGGALFPHLYDKLDGARATREWKLNLDSSGAHVLPDEVRS